MAMAWACLTVMPTALAYEQTSSGLTAGGSNLSSGSFGGFGYLPIQPVGTMHGGNYELSAGLLVAVALPPAAPGVPGILALIPGDARMKVVFSPPSSDGGSPITGYRATCTPLGGGSPHFQDGTGSPIVVGGLANAIAYSCTVHAINAAGTGSDSPQLAKVVNPAPSILPILGIILD
jgi:hypothetical protein